MTHYLLQQGYHPAELFEHMAKMVRLPQPDIASLQPFSYADDVPPVCVIVTDFGPLDLQPGRTNTVCDAFCATSSLSFMYFARHCFRKFGFYVL